MINHSVPQSQKSHCFIAPPHQIDNGCYFSIAYAMKTSLFHVFFFFSCLRSVERNIFPQSEDFSIYASFVICPICICALFFILHNQY